MPAPVTHSAKQLVSLNDVSVRFGEVAALENISLKLNAGEIITAIGPNGAGKSTLIKLIVGLEQPTSGKVTRAKPLRIGYMPQKLHINPQLPLTTERFLLLSGPRSKLSDAVARLDIDCLLKTPVQKLSGGELQRVLLARALMKEPELLVLDEPAQGVDVTGQAELYHLLGELRVELGCAVFMVSHDLHLVMAKTDQVLCLNKHICCHGEPESVSQHPEYIQLFGRKAAEDIAVYTHDHDHAHDLHGDVVDPAHSGCQHHHH